MSRNTLTARTSTGYLISLAAGWDRPTQQLFASYLELDDIPEDAEDAPDCLPDSFDTVEELVQSVKSILGIDLPQEMVTALQSDMDNNVGNELREFQLPS